MPGVNWEMEAKVGLRAVRASRPQHPRVDCTQDHLERFLRMTRPLPRQLKQVFESLWAALTSAPTQLSPHRGAGSHGAGGQLITWYPKCQFSLTQNSLDLTASVSPHKKLGCWRA